MYVCRLPTQLRCVIFVPRKRKPLLCTQTQDDAPTKRFPVCITRPDTRMSECQLFADLEAEQAGDRYQRDHAVLNGVCFILHGLYGPICPLSQTQWQRRSTCGSVPRSPRNIISRPCVHSCMVNCACTQTAATNARVPVTLK